jgi:protein-S-isoprenylcysteine O-methyltransferase Ste14
LDILRSGKRTKLEIGDELTARQRDKLVGYVLVGVASVFTYLPVIAGILTPMLWLLPAWYTAWFGIGFIFPYYPIWGGLWLPNISPLTALVIYTVQGVVFFVGLALFIWSLVEMTRTSAKGIQPVVTGPYRWVRHPQHLGIIMFLLPLALFNVSYSPSWSGVRPGDILSWSLVSFMLVIVADFEELGLVRRFGSEYVDYCKRTPFLLPRMSLLRFMDDYGLLSKGRPLRYVVWFVLYWLVVSLILYSFTLVELGWTM